MNTTILKTILGTAIICFVLAGLSGISFAEKQVTIIFENNYPTQHSRLGEVTIGKWLDAVEEVSGGKISFERHWAGEPVPANEALGALSKGLIDMLVAFPPYYSGEVAIADICAMPQNFKVPADIYDLWWNSPMGDIINKVYKERVGVQIVFPVIFAPENFQVSKKSNKVKKFEDFQGMKIRAGGGMPSETVKAIGGSPVHTHGGEYYTAMQRGTVDAGLMTTYSLETYKMWEVSDQVVNPPILSNCWVGVYINNSKWEQLGADMQKIMLDTARRIQFSWLTYLRRDDSKIQDKAQKKGVEFYTLPPEDQTKMWNKTQKVWDIYVEKCADQGYEKEAKELQDMLRNRFNSY